MRGVFKWVALLSGAVVISLSASGQNQAEGGANSLAVTLQKRIPAKPGSNQYVKSKDVHHWKPAQTAIIICDMWDKHWCQDATDRVNELAPRINEVISIARSMGVLIVHSPSDVMDYYKDYPGRKEAVKYRNGSFNRILVKISGEGLSTEKGAVWPIDQSDGGCSNPTSKEEVNHVVWIKENDQIGVEDNDVISDNGDEIAGVFEARGIKNVIFMGVHTNMCIIQRSFGMRNMVRLGLNVVLMRDMTDLMYNPKRWPYVSHFNGLHLMLAYIEKYIAPTILSSDITKKAPFGFGVVK